MSGFSPRAVRSFEVAGQVFELLRAEGLPSAVIGSIALAVHGYVRATRDLDVGVALLGFGKLARIADQLRAAGFDVHVAAPAPDDDLGGVVTVAGPDFDPVQIVNLTAPRGRHGRLARESIESAVLGPSEFPLPVVDLAHLVALKLVTDARKDELDVVELLKANPDAPLDPLRETCRRFRLGARLEPLVMEARS